MLSARREGLEARLSTIRRRTDIKQPPVLFDYGQTLRRVEGLLDFFATSAATGFARRSYSLLHDPWHLFPPEPGRLCLRADQIVE